MYTNIKELRLARGMSQRLLGEKLHTHPSLLGMVERQKMEAWPKLDKKLKRIFGDELQVKE